MPYELAVLSYCPTSFLYTSLLRYVHVFSFPLLAPIGTSECGKCCNKYTVSKSESPLSAGARVLPIWRTYNDSNVSKSLYLMVPMLNYQL